MPTLIDTSLWIDFTRVRSSRGLKLFIAPFILDPDAHLAEPIMFEVLRHATPGEARQLSSQFQTLPVLPTPANLWASAAVLGQACRTKGLSIGSLDLLIAAVALHHQATVLTFDDDFPKIATLCPLRTKLLRRPETRGEMERR